MLTTRWMSAWGLLTMLASGGWAQQAAGPPQPMASTTLCERGEVKAPQVALSNGFTAITTSGTGYGARCITVIQTAAGDEVERIEDVNTYLNSASGAGVTDDGTAAAVIEGYSGGAHCCDTADIVSLGPHPGRRWVFDEWVGMDGEKPPADVVEVAGVVFVPDVARRRVAMQAWQDSWVAVLPPYRYEAGVPMAFEMDGGGFRDASREVLGYDARIAAARAALTPASIAAFRRTGLTLDACYTFLKPSNCPADLPARDAGYWTTKATIVDLVLLELANGDVAGARRDLKSDWPAADEARMESALLDDFCKRNLRMSFHLPAPAVCPLTGDPSTWTKKGWTPRAAADSASRTPR